MKTVDKIVVLIYNIVLLAGASYLYLEKDVSGWIYFLALCFGASWRDKKDKDD